ncbi:DNA gyrase inhibitor YacG [Salinisphaera sp. USBA-960]|uniref:DNA gyrase inhibitor YacG n=1 Tax=Salinisphaera orenii TaxID=856731 RepID=UPI000DBE2F05|nr:DNA gyrase inhibitor YacG [Salifodinibacter halophilus]NNC26552.1 DNA gyrase inhibitor YacG [Salifodinibacter halophilus]
MSQQQSKCPICGTLVTPSTDNPARPFCSQRCQLIDLGDWIDERHSIPGDESAPWPPDSDVTDSDDH